MENGRFPQEMGLNINYPFIYVGREKGRMDTTACMWKSGQRSSLSSLTPCGLSQRLNSVIRLEPALPLSTIRVLFSQGKPMVASSQVPL